MDFTFILILVCPPFYHTEFYYFLLTKTYAHCLFRINIKHNSAGSRETVVDFTIPYFMEYVTLVSRPPALKNRTFAVFSPFSTQARSSQMARLWIICLINFNVFFRALLTLICHRICPGTQLKSVLGLVMHRSDHCNDGARGACCAAAQSLLRRLRSPTRHPRLHLQRVPESGSSRQPHSCPVFAQQVNLYLLVSLLFLRVWWVKQTLYMCRNIYHLSSLSLLFFLLFFLQPCTPAPWLRF